MSKISSSKNRNHFASLKKAVAVVSAAFIFYCIALPGRMRFTLPGQSITTFESFEDFQRSAHQVWQNSCGLPRSFVFLKTHKTGGTSLKYILKKFRKKHKTENQTSIVRFPKPFVGGYPGSFRKDLSFINLNRHRRKTKKADFLVSHFRFNKNEVQAIMNPRAKYITILRDPWQQFESSFQYYFASHSYLGGKVMPITCLTYPYRYVTGGKLVDISEYILLADKYLNESVPWFFRSRNCQAYDLGLDPLNLSKEYALQQAMDLEENFHLVLILEHFLESLVLLKDLLCMEWNDIVLSEQRNQAEYQHHKLRKEEKRIFGKLSSQDQILYNYFNASLWRKIEIYGRERMKKDIAILKAYMTKSEEQIDERTSLRTDNRLKRLKRNIKPRAKKNVESTTLVDKIVSLQQQISEIPANKSLAYEMANYMTENYGGCPSYEDDSV